MAGAKACCLAFSATLAACASIEPSAPGLNGQPLGQFFDDLKTELRAVHWRIRSASAACDTSELREVDLRNATITLDLARVGEASIDGQLRLVALPLAGTGIAPFASASSSRKWTQEMALKLDVAGPSRIYAVGEASEGGAVAKRVNEAIDGFMRSSAAEPCIRLSSLKLALVIDVERTAAGGFKLVVPVAQVGADASRRDVNTLTIVWDRIVSNALR